LQDEPDDAAVPACLDHSGSIHNRRVLNSVTDLNNRVTYRRCSYGTASVRIPSEFFYNGSRIPDPDPKMEIEQVREPLTPSYPEVATATMTGPEDTETSLRYTFSRVIGSKG
jgi:PRTRC genetic system protein C